VFKKIRRIHFVGIGGIGMSGIAEVMLDMRYQVSGSDLRLSGVTQRLASLGAMVVEGHSKGNVGEVDVVVISSAVKEDNPEVLAARERKIPIIRRAEMLAELMRMKYGIAISGTHGKTTTTSMIGLVLSRAGFDPTIIVGGIVKSIGSNAQVGQGEYLVAEADEFDRSFLKLTPTIAVVTTIEAEHLDCYKDLEEIKKAFAEFANKVPFYGSVALCLDEKGVQAILPRIEKRYITYGLSSAADVQAREMVFKGDGLQGSGHGIRSLCQGGEAGTGYFEGARGASCEKFPGGHRGGDGIGSSLQGPGGVAFGVLGSVPQVRDQGREERGDGGG